jgi:hypothetical protein
MSAAEAGQPGVDGDPAAIARAARSEEHALTMAICR